LTEKAADARRTPVCRWEAATSYEAMTVCWFSEQFLEARSIRPPLKHVIFLAAIIIFDGFR
jgi:hypothetical protein